MTASQQLLALFGGLGAFLAAASLTGFLLARRTGGQSAGIENLNARIGSWWVMVALLAGAFALGRAGVILLFAFASFAALREFLTLTPTRRGDHPALVASFFVVLPAHYALIWTDWYGFYTILIPVYAFLLLPVVAALRGETGRFLERVSKVLWALMICVYCLSHVPALLTLDIPGAPERALTLAAFVLLVTQASDVLQYVWGKLLGRRKIAPSLSPSKTWEGFVGGVLGAALLGTALYPLTPFTPGQAFLMSLLLGLAGFCGGLVMSAIKRDSGVKDWGHAIAGHGGVLDRCDSLVFAAPLFFHVTRYFWTI